MHGLKSVTASTNSFSVIRTYDFTIKREKKAPDGYLKNVLVINGQFPGPLIEANWLVAFPASFRRGTNTVQGRYHSGYCSQPDHGPARRCLTPLAWNSAENVTVS
jgi:hypothetical protein